MATPTAGHPSQPNLDLSPEHSTWRPRFWMVTALTGAAAGLAGGALMQLLRAVEHVSWRYDAGTLLDAASRDSAWRHVLMLLAAGLVVAAGRTLLTRAVGPAGEVDAAIWFRSGRLPTVATLVQATHTIVTVGMGTSLGRESPIKQAGGAIASRLAVWAGLSRAEERLLVACGVGAGMAAAYNVPVGGALYAVEVLLGSISLRLALPALLCSGVATVSSWALLPTGPIYRVPEYPLSVQLIAWSLLAGPLLGLATVPLVRLIGWAEAHRPRGTVAQVVAPVVLLTALGGLSIAFPQLLGNGKDAVQLAFADQFGLWLLLVLPALKLVATVGCLAGGASGGLFTPTMTIGALLGGLFGHAWNGVWPGASMGSCSVIGGCAFLAAASQGPVSALVLVLELTRHVDATMAPMLLTVVGAMLVARRIESRSIYSIRIRPDGPATAAALPTWPHLGARVSRDFATVPASMGYGQAVAQVLAGGRTAPVYVVDDRGQLVGTLGRASFDPAVLGAMPVDAAQAGDVANPLRPLTTDMGEQQLLDEVARSDVGELPLVDPATRRMVAIVSTTAAEGNRGG